MKNVLFLLVVSFALHTSVQAVPTLQFKEFYGTGAALGIGWQVVPDGSVFDLDNTPGGVAWNGTPSPFWEVSAAGAFNAAVPEMSWSVSGQRLRWSNNGMWIDFSDDLTFGTREFTLNIAGSFTGPDWGRIAIGTGPTDLVMFEQPGAFAYSGPVSLDRMELWAYVASSGEVEQFNFQATLTPKAATVPESGTSLAFLLLGLSPLPLFARLRR